jgi:hypothetical protein
MGSGKSATLEGTVPPMLTLTLLVGTEGTAAACPAKYALIVPMLLSLKGDVTVSGLV